MSSVTIPKTELEQYLAIKDMMASNLCARGVFTLPDESLAKMASKILNIDSGIPYFMVIGGSIASKPASNTGYSSASITLAPPTSALNWGGLLGTRNPPAADCRLVSAVLRASWYSGTGYSNYNSVHSIYANENYNLISGLDGSWATAVWNYYIVNRPYYNSYPDTSFNTSTMSASSSGNITFNIAPYSNSTNYYYFNPNYLSLSTAVWLVKRPFN